MYGLFVYIGILICLEFRFRVAERGGDKGKDDSGKVNHGRLNYQVRSC